MTATPYLSLEYERPTTLRARWLRLLRDLYALPSFQGELMDDVRPAYPRPSLVLVKGGAQRPDASHHVESAPITHSSAATNRHRKLRLVVVGREDNEAHAPAHSDIDDSDLAIHSGR